MNIYRHAGNIKAGLFAIAVSLMAALFLYTQSIITDLRDESRRTVSLYAHLIADAATSADDRYLDFVFREIILKVTFPIVRTDTGGRPVEWSNLPNSVSDTAAVVALVRQMDRGNPPLQLTISLDDGSGGTASYSLGHLHFGDSRLIHQLTLLPVIGVGAVALYIFIGFAGFQLIRRSERRYIWYGLARETAHQLGTPVSSVLGWVDRLREKPEEAAAISEELARDTERLREISDRFSRMGSVPKLEAVVLGSVLSEVVSYFERRLPRTGKSVALETAGDLSVAALANPTLLSWAIENLVKNAIDSIRHDHGKVVLFSGREGGKGVIRVTDNGSGIRRRDWRNIFRPGFTTKERGWGLGLSLTKRIVEEFLRGSVRVAVSSGEEGTTMEIRLPLAGE